MGVSQAFPYHGFLAKRLRNLPVNGDLTGVELVTYPFKLFFITSGIYPDLFDTDICACIKFPFVCVTESARCSRHLVRERKSPGHLVGCRESRPKAAYLAQHMEALSERLTRTIKLVKDLWVQRSARVC